MQQAARPPSPIAASAVRALWFYGFWLVSIATPAVAPADWIAGLAFTWAATVASLRLVPAGAVRWRAAGVARIALHFVRCSIVAGWDVARRALAPRLPLAPGIVEQPTTLVPEHVRSGFVALASLLPGTVPIESRADGTVRYHCLDVRQPIAAQLARDEALFDAALARRDRAS